MFSLQVSETAVQTHPALAERATHLAERATHLAPRPPPKYLKSLNFPVYKIRY
jgi:hypothetical protein